MQLSIRMQAVADMVTPGGKVADVGTDHGYVPIYLIEKRAVGKSGREYCPVWLQRPDRDASLRWFGET